MKNLWFLVLIALVAALGADASGTTASDPNDPNALLLKKWDVTIKDPNDPNQVLWTKWNAAVKVLQTKHLSPETKAKVVDLIVTPIFDFPLMAKLVLGRKHWPKFDEQQRKKFTKLFTKRLKASYREKISLYTDEKASLKPLQRKKSTVIIPMELISQDQKIERVYKLRKLGKTWRIYDVEIQGVSILLTYRSQFDDVLQKESVEELLLRLEKPPAK
ncbi:MAG: Tgt2/MlaC family protein [Planctomycetota bacterium]